MGKFDLAGRKALVTGGARGIGRAIAEGLVAAGASVAICDILESEGRDTVEALRGNGANALFVPLDVTREADWEAAVGTVIAQFSGYDILVNNAGIEITSLVIDQSAADLRKMLEVNVIGVSLGIKHAFRAMKPKGPAGGGGAIVNIASTAAIAPFPAISGYAATKSAVDRLTRVAALESGTLGYGVRVNCIYPGLMATIMGNQLAVDMAKIGFYPTPQDASAGVVGITPMGRLGDISEVADATVFLCSDAARFITGTGLPVSGGQGN